MRKLKIISLSIMFALCITTLSLANSIDTLITAANSGDANAMYELGRVYQKGAGVAKSDAEATKWFTKAAELNHPRALFSLGYMYSEGIGVKYNTKKAYLYYKRAADLGNPAAMNNLGAIYEKGEVICVNKALAIQYYQEAVKHGCTEAEFNMSRIDMKKEGPWGYNVTFVNDDEVYYKKWTNMQKNDSTVNITKTIKNNDEDDISVYAGFDIAKKVRSRDGYMIVYKVLKGSDAEKKGLLEGCDLFQIDNMNTKLFSQQEIAQYITKSAEKQAAITVVFMAEDGTPKRIDIKLK